MFDTRHFSVRPLQAGEVPQLQALFDAHPEYFMAVNGRRAHPDEAATEFAERPPPHLSYGGHWFGGVFDRAARLCGALVLVADLCAATVWHLSLLWLATPLQRRGFGTELYQGLESWLRDRGAAWLRLGVVVGNRPAERFWQRQGFAAVRLREGVDTGGAINAVQLMVKALGPQALDAYLERVPRDRPGSDLP